ncbi:hypothetical protein A4X06_0g4042 [Tilletia controversa]|uniref:RPA43 OB domain-containing protein n=1 Tax=Tilletia controversa TaxID=13291 RepID=A0A8X7SWW3_9BASI|nr:hypothetical protein A4X06_0g4042 [Tilletia controversa]
MSTVSTSTPSKASSSSSSPKKRKRDEAASSATPKSTITPKQARKDKKQEAAAAAEDTLGLAARAGRQGGVGNSPASKQTNRKAKSRTSLSAAGVTTSTSSEPNGPQSAYRVVYPVLNMPIAPVWWKHPLGAVRELFDTMVMRYVPQLNGILIAHENHTFLAGAAEIRADSAFATAPVKVKCTIWAPSIGMRLEGKIVYSNTDVVSLLLNGTFNAAIPAAHLPPNQYEFVQNEYNHGAAAAHSADGGGGGEGGEEDFGAHSPGFWRRKRDQAPLGGSSGRLTFTCFGITVANQLLFLRGSLLDDPLGAVTPGDASSSSAAAGSSASPSVDARALQTLFPNVNLDFSSKDGLESGARRSAVRGANANGEVGAGGAEGEGSSARRRVRWFDEDEADEDGVQLVQGGGGASALAQESDGEDGEGDVVMVSAPTISNEKAALSANSADKKPAKSSGAEDDEDDEDDDDDDDEDGEGEEDEAERKRERKRAKAERKAEKAGRKAEREAKRAKKEAKKEKKKAKSGVVKKEPGSS